MAKPDMTDFSEFLLLGPNGRVWWRLQDAFKLGAGFVPRRDDHVAMTSQLVPPNNRARANERGLLGAFHDSRHGIAAPQIAIRSDGNFVSAHDFLLWLGQHILKSGSSIAFPAEIARKVADVERSHNGAPRYESWRARLENLYELPRASLPGEIVAPLKRDMFPFDWDELASEQRAGWAEQWDAQNDPARASEIQFWFDHCIRRGELESQIAEWKSKQANTVADTSTKENRLADLRAELSEMDKAAGRAKPLFPDRSSDGEDDVTTIRREYVAYPAAMQKLAEKYSATPVELAMWVFCGAGDGGGINAYANANELDPPPRFVFPYESTDFNYLSPLMRTWYDVAELEAFEPRDRFISGQDLIDRWSQYADIVVDVDGFIAAKISESRLSDAHPMEGFTQWMYPANKSMPPKESAIFCVREVEDIEVEDGLVKGDVASLSSKGGNAVSAEEIMRAFRKDPDDTKNEVWWGERMSDAADYGLEDCRAAKGKPGIKNSSRWWPSEIAGWLVDKGHFNERKAAALLRHHFPDCSEAADLLDPP
jgi:hypothetical protein